MKAEIDALERNGTWIIADLLLSKNAIRCKWVYKIKYNSDGTIERFKTSLVVLENNQIEGIDYHETFAPVAKMVSIRTFLTVAAIRNWELHHMDVHNAFLHGNLVLHGDLDEEVYIRLPPVFSSSPEKVCKLHKSLYGLRQAPRNWLPSVIHTSPMRLFCDSQAPLHITANPVFHERTKHIDVDCQYMCDQILVGLPPVRIVSASLGSMDIQRLLIGRRGGVCCDVCLNVLISAMREISLLGATGERSRIPLEHV
ncbi:UNVERIFIED_CONTAM: Retrovirus-related Pol polyprotein from transposon RE1 [Sesamum radiatum]|uniref:Retrovirus-related Pol polyprotein from transposon RE1 n=1 Tax=Sesamum radiatum TaxID=300843 RepID=A0AAW2LL76_SESRA